MRCIYAAHKNNHMSVVIWWSDELSGRHGYQFVCRLVSDREMHAYVNGGRFQRSHNPTERLLFSPNQSVCPPLCPHLSLEHLKHSRKDFNTVPIFRSSTKNS